METSRSSPDHPIAAALRKLGSLHLVGSRAFTPMVVLLDRLSEARADLARVTEQRDRARSFIVAHRGRPSSEWEDDADVALADDPPKEAT